jgi:hypothetical protein
MENYSIVIFILAIMIVLSAVADKIRLPYPVLLITAGIGIGFIPTLPNITLNPEVVFLLFLRHCYTMRLSIYHRRNLKPISIPSVPSLLGWYLLRLVPLR